MAFSKAPTQDTYSSKRFLLTYDTDIHATDTSFSNPLAGMFNVIPFKNSDSTSEFSMFGETRLAIDKLGNVGAGTSIVRGMHTWEKTIGTAYYYFMVVSTAGTTHIYTSTNATTWTSVNSWVTSETGPARFVEFIDDTNTKKLVMVDGVRGYVFTDNTAGTQIVDVDFPTPHIPFPIFLNARLYLAKTGTGDIYNSNLNDPALWTAGDFISTEVYPDDLQALIKVNNYILAVGKEASEFFYDAANATGSPLSRESGALLPFGTLFPNTIASNKDTTVLLANSNDAESSFKIIEGFKYADLPGETILKVLQNQISQATTTGPKLRGCFLRQNGQLLYVLNFNGASTGANTAPTAVASLQNKMWSVFDVDGAYAYPVWFSNQSTSNDLVTYVAGQFNGQGYFGRLLPLNQDDLPDGAHNIRQNLYIPPQAFGTMNRKFMYRLAVQYVPTFTQSVPVQVSYSDDLGKTFSSLRTLDGRPDEEIGFPFLTQLGQFRQRMFRIFVNTTYGRVRWEFMEVDINKGQQ